MKTISIYAVMAILALGEVNAAATPKAEYHVVQDTPFGPVYSSVAPKVRRDEDSFHPVGHNADGTVYSNSPSAYALFKRDNPYTPVPQSDVVAYINEHGLQPDGSIAKRDEPLEKRDFAACVACVAACGLLQNGIHLLSISQQVQFCLGNCALQGACTDWFRTRYVRDYGNVFPPQA